MEETRTEETIEERNARWAAERTIIPIWTDGHGGYRATCSCGWSSVWRRKESKAIDDAKEHTDEEHAHQ